MARKRFTCEEIINQLRGAEVALSQGQLRTTAWIDQENPSALQMEMALTRLPRLLLHESYQQRTSGPPRPVNDVELSQWLNLESSAEEATSLETPARSDHTGR